MGLIVAVLGYFFFRAWARLIQSRKGHTAEKASWLVAMFIYVSYVMYQCGVELVKLIV